MPLLVWAITFNLSGKGDPTSSKLPPALLLGLAKVIPILKHSVRLRRYLLFSGVACPSVVCVLCAVQSTAHSTHTTLEHAATPLNNK